MIQAPSIEDALRRSAATGNNFDSIRLFAASLVIIAHCFLVAGGLHERYFVPPLSDGTGFGELAVHIFFALSGFLVMRSWMANPRPAVFFLKRSLRIFPALMFTVLALTFVVGPLVTTAPLADYFASPQTWAFLLNIGFLSQFSGLPGVFETAPYAGWVDVSLWTLGFEMACYAALAALGAAGLARPVILIGVTMALHNLHMIDGLRSYGAIGDALFRITLIGPHFFAGAAAAAAARYIPLDRRLAFASLAVLVLTGTFGGFGLAFSVFGTYLILWIGLTALGPLRHAGRYGDFSYGVYLWGCPAQQLVQAYIYPSDWAMNVALSVPLALVAAAFSWTFVEKPALGLKRRLATASAGKSPLTNRKTRNGPPKALPPRADIAIRIQNHD